MENRIESINIKDPRRERYSEIRQYQRLTWLGISERVGDDKLPKKVFMGKWRQERHVESQGRDGCKTCKRTGVGRWWERVQGREEWRCFVKEGTKVTLGCSAERREKSIYAHAYLYYML